MGNTNSVNEALRAALGVTEEVKFASTVRGAAVSNQARPEWAALSLAVNTLLQRAATAQGLINQHEFLPADTDAVGITEAVWDCEASARTAMALCMRWREAQS